MKKASSSSHSLGSFPSPGAPRYRDREGLGSLKGWSSERIPKPAGSGGSSIRRHTMAGLTPFSGGRTTPSKWDEAERWICSPISAHADGRAGSRAQLQQRRPKSISGPIVPPPPVAYYYSDYSPAVTVPLRQGLVVRNLMAGSPFSTGVLAPLAVSLHRYDPHGDAVFGYDAAGSGTQQYSFSPVLNGSGLYGAPSSAEQPCDPSSPISQDEKHVGIKDEDTVILSGCDKGTQMSPSESENDARSSPESSAANSVRAQRDCRSPKLVVRDVQVDCQASFVRGPKRHASKSTGTDSLHSRDFREDSTQAQSSSWDIEESTSDISKLHREEAKIVAWENLQKAKAEAAVRKLEMKLEKRRSSSMDKILSKLRKAQMKAENMRSLTPLQQDHRVSKTCNVFPFSKYARIWSPISCFGSHAQ